MRTLFDNISLADAKREMSRFIKEGMCSSVVRQTATDIALSSLDSAPQAIFNWVKSNINYVADPEDIELFVSPVKILEKHVQGITIGVDCDDQAMLVAAMLGSIGIKTRVAIIFYNGEAEHAVAEYYSDSLRQWVELDTTNSYPLGWYNSYSKKEYVYA